MCFSSPSSTSRYPGRQSEMHRRGDHLSGFRCPYVIMLRANVMSTRRSMPRTAWGLRLMAFSFSLHRISPQLIATIIGMVGTMAYSQDGAAQDAPESGRPRSLAGHSRPLSVVAFGPDGSRVAAVEDDGTVNVYDATSGRVLWRAADPQKALVYLPGFQFRRFSNRRGGMGTMGGRRARRGPTGPGRPSEREHRLRFEGGKGQGLGSGRRARSPHHRRAPARRHGRQLPRPRRHADHHRRQSTSG